MGTSLLRTALKDLSIRLPKTLIEDLEIVTSCEIQTSTNKTTEQSQEDAQTNQGTIFAKFTTTIYKDTCKRAAQLPTIFSNIGCLISSALAVVFVKATGKPVTIKTQNTSEDGVTNETEYTVIREPAT